MSTAVQPTEPRHDEVSSPSPGWYDDPHAPGVLRYWNGRAWTDTRAVRSTGAAMPARPRRRFWWIWIPAVAVLGAGALFGALVVFDRTVLTHHLLSADFDNDAKPFAVGSAGDYRYSLSSGNYRVEATQAPSGPAAAYAWFARTAYSVDVSADVVLVGDGNRNDTVGVACADEPEGNSHGYLFTISGSGYELVKMDASGGDRSLSRVNARHSWAGQPQRIRISCYPQIGNDVEVRGYVDGVEVISAEDADGFDTYRTGVLLFWPAEKGDFAHFDNVEAVVPGE